MLESPVAEDVSGLEHCRLPEPKPIESTSPSGAAALRECLLRTAYSSDDSFRSLAASTRAARLGTACHEVLEAAGSGRLPEATDPAWRSAFEELWAAAISLQEQRAARSPLEAHWGPAVTWPNYAKKKVSTRRLCERIAKQRPAHRDHDQSSSTRGVREQRQSAFGGRLVGKADVIIRTPEPVIEDYKTGAVFEPDDSGEVKQHYRLQMLLYAVLEHEETGIWPLRAYLIPLDGPRVEIQIDAGEADQAAMQALEDLAHYNRAVEAGGDPSELGSPSPETCLYCQYAIECPAFWRTVDPAWGESNIVAVSGQVNGSEAAQNGMLSIAIRVVRGSVPPGDYHLYDLDPQRFAVLASAPSGTEAAANWLYGDPASWQLRPTSLTRAARALPG
jgi:hypothetical protein